MTNKELARPKVMYCPTCERWQPVSGWHRGYTDGVWGPEKGCPGTPIDLVARIAELEAEVSDCDELNTKLAGILSEIAITVKGPEPPLTRWGWHDLPALVKELKVSKATRIATVQRPPLSLEESND